MPPEDEDEERYHGVLHTLGDMATELRQHKERVLATVLLLTDEFRRHQHIFDQAQQEHKEERADDIKGRDEQRRRADRFRWATIALIVVLVIVNLLVLMFFIGRGLR